MFQRPKENSCPPQKHASFKYNYIHNNDKISEVKSLDYIRYRQLDVNSLCLVKMIPLRYQQAIQEF